MDDDDKGPRLSKRFNDKEGEVDYRTKAGTAWSHNFLNQKPWHPLSYPNQRRKWIAEQTHAQRERRSEEVAREMEMMKAVSFMYIRPPGYNPESAKAAEIADERKKQEPDNHSHDPHIDVAADAMLPQSVPSGEEKKKPRPKDVFGRALPTEEQFEVLKDAPRLETGVAGRAKPFGVEIRNVKCLRCGTYGHQSGDRECPLRDAIMPNEESRLKRDDPLTAILAHTDCTEPLKWELKQKPGMSPPRGGFNPDDPNQQIVAEEIFDEYGGFLGGESIPELLANYSSTKPKKKSTGKKRHKRPSSPKINELRDHQEYQSSSEDDGGRRSKKKIHAKKKRKHSESSSSGNAESDRHNKGNRHRRRHSSPSYRLGSDGHRKGKKQKQFESSSSGDSDDDKRHNKRNRHRRRDLTPSYMSDSNEQRRSKNNHQRPCISGSDRSKHSHRHHRNR
ncbi:hypothetical protein RJ639_038013 [Escallonia herrerae]|uniref:CBF1-interacting co-repressor CIR N-terminal domain-containing protein n=1 Tax=Escallonia herrerae TaxID=1293975 RepID=A0AA88WKW4_9ASTE|nr:hypothetical protein RJ639_038013 [Escallonia herrerae]